MLNCKRKEAQWAHKYAYQEFYVNWLSICEHSPNWKLQSWLWDHLPINYLISQHMKRFNRSFNWEIQHSSLHQAKSTDVRKTQEVWHSDKLINHHINYIFPLFKINNTKVKETKRPEYILFRSQHPDKQGLTPSKHQAENNVNQEATKQQTTPSPILGQATSYKQVTPHSLTWMRLLCWVKKHLQANNQRAQRRHCSTLSNKCSSGIFLLSLTQWLCAPVLRECSPLRLFIKVGLVYPGQKSNCGFFSLKYRAFKGAYLACSV